MSNTEKTQKNEQQKYYIGLMSGTSADGIDLALVSFEQNNANRTSKLKLNLKGSYYQAYSDDIIQKITSLYNPNTNEIDRAFSLDIELATLFSQAIHTLLTQENLCCDDIIAIGNHGQTIRHRANITHPFTLQIGCNQTLATLTNIRVIGQFRRKDMALGGQGAPLVPAFHQQIFTEASQDTFVVNIGGIANISYLPGTDLLSTKHHNKQVLGFDTGPGNALMDDWYQHHNSESLNKYDKGGIWASKGTVNQALLTRFLADSYFALPAPKSTGREYFNPQWVQQQLDLFYHENSTILTNQDIQATLTTFTAITISDAIKQLSSKAKVYLCGGGVHNHKLINELNQSLQKKAVNYEILLTNQKDIDCDLLEAIAFAWFAFAYDKMLLSSIPDVTGASKSCTLGTAFYP